MYDSYETLKILRKKEEVEGQIISYWKQLRLDTAAITFWLHDQRKEKLMKCWTRPRGFYPPRKIKVLTPP